MKIDAHQHFWQISRGDYGWLTPEFASIYRDFGPQDLNPLLASAGVDATILVQAAPSEAETRFLLEIAAVTPFVAGVVGWCDFAKPDAPARIAALAQDRNLVGLRPMVQDIVDDDWLLEKGLQPAFSALKLHDLVFDALVLPRHLPRLLKVAKAHPELAIVIDHAAKPDFSKGISRDWFEDMAALARLPNVTCKLSGLVTEIGPGWKIADIEPVLAHLLAEFGANRLIWGSDWPVLTLAADYASWSKATEALLARLPQPERDAILGDNAARIYLEKRGKSEKNHAQGD